MTAGSKLALVAVGVPTLFVGGIAGYVSYANSKLEPVTPDPAASLVFRAPREHPVTPAMLAAARELGKAPAPEFGLVDTEARYHTLKSLTQGKPLVMFFVELECPCCKGAKDTIDAIHEVYGDVCNVVGVINAEPPLAKAWVNAVQPKFPILCDPQMTTIHAYKAERGVYTTLVTPDGQVAKAYPGYSQGMLAEIAGKIERLAGIEKRSISLKTAPKELISGCEFPAGTL
jgi:peroxiredoxin